MHRRITFALLTSALLFAGCESPEQPRSAGSAPVPRKVAVPTVLILDASGSMTTADAPGPRIDAAKRAAEALIDQLPDDAVIGLTTYGTGTGSSEAEKPVGCQDVATLIPLQRLDRAQMAQQITGLTPSGFTPIGLALTRAADQLPAGDADQAIVLVSDGEDTCGVPPCDTAAQLKKTHPGLTISTVGFKTDGPASEQLACVAGATGGVFVNAANADQLASRLVALQDVDEAKKSLTSAGIDGIALGLSLDEIRAARPDFPDGDRAGRTVIVYVDCDFGFVDGVLDSIAPHNGGRTIDGVESGTDLQRATELYGDPVRVDATGKAVVYRADPSDDTSEAGYRIEVEGFAESGGGYITGRVKTIVLCRCAPVDTGQWTAPLVIVTPNSIGAARLGMSELDIEQAAGVELATACTQCDAQPTAILPPGDYYPVYGAWPSRLLTVYLGYQQEFAEQVVRTADGFRLGDSVDELRRIYGDRIQPYEALGMHSVRGYVLPGPGGYLVFNTLDMMGADQTGSRVYEFVVRESI